MPAKSEKQRRFFGAVMGAKKHQKGVLGAAKKAAKDMTTKQIRDFLKKENFTFKEFYPVWGEMKKKLTESVEKVYKVEAKVYPEYAGVLGNKIVGNMKATSPDYALAKLIAVYARKKGLGRVVGLLNWYAKKNGARVVPADSVVTSISSPTAPVADNQLQLPLEQTAQYIVETGFSKLPKNAPYGFWVTKDGKFITITSMFGHDGALRQLFPHMTKSLFTAFKAGFIRMVRLGSNTYGISYDPFSTSSVAKKTAKDIAKFYDMDVKDDFSDI